MHAKIGGPNGDPNYTFEDDIIFNENQYRLSSELGLRFQVLEELHSHTSEDTLGTSVPLIE